MGWNTRSLSLLLIATTAGSGFMPRGMAATRMAPQATGSQTIQPSPAAAELLEVLVSQMAWLSRSPHGPYWQESLRTAELQGQLQLGDFANREVVSDILDRYSNDAAGLRHRRFVAVRLALRNWLAELEFRRNTSWPAPIYAQNALSRLPLDRDWKLASDRARGALHAYCQATGAASGALPTLAGRLRRELHTDGIPHGDVLETALDRLAPEALGGDSPADRLRRALSAQTARLAQAQATSGVLVRAAAPRVRPAAHLPVQWFGAEAWTPKRCAALLTRMWAQPRAYLGQDESPPNIPWYDDLAAACFVARQRQALLFVVLHGTAQTEHAVVQAHELRRLAATTRGHRYVWACLPLDHRTYDGGVALPIADHSAFRPLEQRPGVAIIDYESPAATHYEEVVSAFPHRPGRPYGREELMAMLDLPPGTLTQRTLIYAVRTHPDAPRSAHGLPHHVLASDAELHSTHQARTAQQGHGDWATRMRDLERRTMGRVPSECTAASRPRQSLLDAAVDCVRSWRLSPAHWQAIHAPHAEYAFDMRRGENGVWYATGLFAD